MLRLSDGRMSGTAYGAVVLHIAPESAIGGPLALVEDGDLIELDLPARRLHLHVSDEQLASRRAAWHPPAPVTDRGYTRIFLDHTQQADRGVDFDVLVGGSGGGVVKTSDAQAGS